MSEYKVGTIIICCGVEGKVVENIKLHRDICVLWEEYDHISSYDKEWLDENAEIYE